MESEERRRTKIDEIEQARQLSGHFIGKALLQPRLSEGLDALENRLAKGFTDLMKRLPGNSHVIREE